MSLTSITSTSLMHVYIITEHCGCSRTDLYLNDIVECLLRYGHNVTIVACAIDTDAAITFILYKVIIILIFYFPNLEHRVALRYRKINNLHHVEDGYFEDFLAYVTLLWGAIYIFLASFNVFEEGVVIVDNTTTVLPILKFSLFHIIYLQHFPEIYEMNEFHGNQLVANRTDYYFTKFADHIIVESTGLKEIFENLNPNVKAPITPLYYITDCKALLPPLPHNLKKMFPKLKLHKATSVFLCIGKYNKLNNLYFLFNIIDCISELYAEYIEKITIIFLSEQEKLDPVSSKYCEKFHKKSFSKKYQLNLMFVDKAKVTHREYLFSKATAILHMNPCDYYPGPILKAMALQKAIIAPKTGFASEVLINYFSGILVNYEVEEYAEAMIEILKDKDLRRDLASNAYDVFKHQYAEEALGARINDIILSPNY